MNNHPIQSILHHLAEDAIPSQEIDLWPALHAQTSETTFTTTKGDSRMNTHLRGPRVATTLILITLLLITLLLITPWGQAWAQSVLHFFSHAEGDTHPVSTIIPTLAPVLTEESITPLPTLTQQPAITFPFQETCGKGYDIHCSVGQIREMVDFPVKELIFLPESWEYVGATGGPEQVMLRYQSNSGIGTIELWQSISTSPDEFLWPIGTSATIESIEIGNVMGEYVQGGWLDTGQNTGSVTWNNELSQRTIRWEVEGIRYTLQFTPNKSANGREPNQAMMIDFANNLTLGPSSVIVPTPTAIAALEEIRTAASFEIREPGWIPERYAFANAMYTPENNAVCLLYGYPNSIEAPTLVIVESPDLLSLEDVIVTSINGHQIDPYRSVYTETLTVGGSIHEQALYISNGMDINQICNTSYIISNHMLFWQTDGKSFIISGRWNSNNGRGFLTRLEMRRIAEGLTGKATIPTDELDPGYLSSIEAVESLAGFAIKTPSQLPDDVHFAYAVYESDASRILPFNVTPWEDFPTVGLIYFASTRDEFGGYDSYTFYQAKISDEEWAKAEELLESEAIANEYEQVIIHGKPAFYSDHCRDESGPGGETACSLNLIWLENGMKYDITAHLPGMPDKDVFIAIAESLK